MFNILKTFIFLALLSILFIVVGNLIGGKPGMTVALFMALFMNLIAYFFSDKIVLATTGAIPVERDKEPELHNIVEDVARRAGIPKPKIYIIPVETPNAFATGRNPKNGVIAVTAGLKKLLSHEELKGVIAHEIAHIKNRDILISTIAAVLVGAITYLAYMAQWALMFGGFKRDDEESSNPLGIIATLIAIIIVPIAATLIQLAISRSREYLADETGAKTIKNPIALAKALEKLENWNRAYPIDVNPAHAQMYIVNPLSSKSIFKLLSTHPPIEERVAKLMKMAKEGI